MVGGDHLIYVDFKQRFDLEARIRHGLDEGRLEVVENLNRCQKMAGIAVLDVSGHRVTDAFLAAMLHQAFLLGAIYELDMFGQVTRRLFENLNTRFYQSSTENKFVSMIYGEISEDSRFRFLSAGQPFPAVFSKQHDRFMDVSQDLCVSFPPLGMLPSLHVTDRNKTTSLLGFKDHYETAMTTTSLDVSKRSSGTSSISRLQKSSTPSRQTCWPSASRPTISASWSSSGCKQAPSALITTRRRDPAERWVALVSCRASASNPARSVHLWQRPAGMPRRARSRDDA